MALSKDQAKAFYDKALEAGYSDDEIVTELKKRNAAPAKKEQLFELSEGKGLSPLDMVKMSANALQQSPMGQYVTGAAQQLGETARGGRQLFNSLTGDTEELDRLKAEEVENERRAEALREPGVLNTLLRGAGRGTAALAPMAIPAAGASTLPGVASTLGRAVAGAAGGALGGAAQPLQTGQGEMEERLPGAILGGTLGAALPVAGEAGSKLFQMLRRMEPDEALQKFTKQQLGASRGGENLPAYQNVGRKVQEAETAQREIFKERYASVENQPGLPPVQLGAAQQGANEVPSSLSDEVLMALSPTARRVVEGVKAGSTRTSPILDVNEKPIQSVQETTFADVRQTIRDLRRVSRTLRRSEATSGQAAVVDRMQDNLQSDLDTWASQNPEKLSDVLREAGDVDRAYRTDVRPFDDVQTALGKFGRTNQYDEQTLDRVFMNNQSGQALQDMLRRVPGAEKDLRQIYGSKLLQSRGRVGNIGQMEGGTAGEVLLKPQEREYLTTIADHLRDQNPSNDVTLGLIRRLERMPGVRQVLRTMTGIDPYAEAKRGVYSTQYLTDALRSALVGNIVTGE